MSKSTITTRINAFARDLAQFIELKSELHVIDRVNLEDLLRLEFDWLMRQDLGSIERLQRDESFGA